MHGRAGERLQLVRGEAEHAVWVASGGGVSVDSSEAWLARSVMRWRMRCKAGMNSSSASQRTAMASSKSAARPSMACIQGSSGVRKFSCNAFAFENTKCV